MIKIGFVIGEYPDEETRRRERVIKSYENALCQIEIFKVGDSPYKRSLTPAHIELLAPAYIQAFMAAEARGCDAAIPLGALDLGVDGGRSAVNIPVIGPCEAALHIAAQLADRIGLIAYHDDMIPFQAAIVRRLGFENRVAGWRSSGLHVTEFAERGDSLLDVLVDRARSLIERDGAEAIIPMGITQCPIHVSPRELSERIGVPVVEAIGAPIQMAALMVSLGLKHSIKRWPKMQRD